MLALALQGVAQNDDDHTITDGIGRTYLSPNSFAPVPPSTFAVGTAPTTGFALDVHGEQMNPPLGNVFKTNGPDDKDTYWRMFRGGKEYGNIFNLTTKNDWNLNATAGYMKFHTNSLERMRLSPTLTGQTINGYPGLDLSGYLCIGTYSGAANAVEQAYTLLHLNEYGVSPGGYRPWMRVGMMATRGSDMSYFGIRSDASGASQNTVVAWCDNPLGEISADALQFVFSAHPTGGTGIAGTLSGLEAGRFISAVGGNEAYFGLGDYYSAGTNPGQRLDVLTGKVRIRKLPDDPAATEPYKIMVVDDSPGTSVNRGIVKWIDPTSLLSGCEWTLQGVPGSNSHISTAYTGNTGCPQMGRGVGIGVMLPQAKLDVRHTVFSQGLGRIAINGAITLNDPASNFVGILGTSDDVNGSALAALVGIGVYGRSAKARDSYGVKGDGTKDISGGVGEVAGVYGKANVGGYMNFGLAAGVLGETSNVNATGSWAGYFRGNVNSTATGYFVNGSFVASDAQFKTNVQPMEDPIAVLMQLHPDHYTYLVDEFPQMNFPAGEYGGFIAQEVEAVLPSLVRQTRIAAVTDTLGNEITPAVDYKAVNYAGFTPYIVGAIQQQQAIIEQQNLRIDQLLDQINQCCAANGSGMAPNHGDQRSSSADSSVQEQRLIIIPNPVADLTTLAYYVPNAGQVSLLVSTSDGKPLETLREEKAEAGAYNYTWNTTKLAAGTYFCTFMLDAAVVVKRAVKVK
ncbi:MAG: tail fiber domain-containing protein [Flavobacteriales bacterium]